MSSTVSICTKHTPAAKLQALSKSCLLSLLLDPVVACVQARDAGLQGSGGRNLGLDVSDFGVWKEDCHLAWQEARVQKERELKKGIQGRSLVTYCLVGW